MTPGGIFFGITLALFAEFVVAFGNIQIKFSHKLNMISCTHIPVYKRLRWWIGFIMYLLNALFKFSSYMFASLNILSPISSLCIIINIFLANYYFKEKLTITGVIGSIFIVIGCILCVVFGQHAPDEITRKTLFKYAHTNKFISFTVLHVSMCLLFGLIGIYFVLDSAQPRTDTITHINLEDDKKSIATTSVSSKSIFQTTEAKNEFLHVSICFLLSFTTSGVCAWVQMLGKISADLLWESVFMNNNQFTKMAPFIIIILLCVLLGFELYLVSEIMRLYDAILVIPIFNSLLILTTIAISAAYFHNFATFSIFNLVFFILGLFFIICGMLLLMHGQKHSSMQHRQLDRCLNNSFTRNMN